MRRGKGRGKEAGAVTQLCREGRVSHPGGEHSGASLWGPKQHIFKIEKG